MIENQLGKNLHHSLTCPYHQWAFKHDGKCASRTTKTHAYPVVEKYGYIWIFNGETADFPEPSTSWSEEDHYIIRLPANLTRCHSHVLGTNVADLNHLETLHGFTFIGTPELVEESAFKLVHHYTLQLNPKNTIEKLFSAYAGNIHDFKITLYGDNNVIMDISAKNYSLKALINIVATGNGYSLGKTILFISRGRGIIRYLRLNLLKVPLLIASFIDVQRQDVKIFNTIRFKARPTENDQSILRYMKLVERLGAFHPTDAKKCQSPQTVL